jgi:membrane-associated protease RseP (regulator of RpoE activity)
MFLLLIVSACQQNPYAKFYEPSGNLSVAKQTPPERINPEIFKGSGDFDSDLFRMFEDGYVLIGRSSFTGPSVENSEAIEQAKFIGATRIIIFSKYHSTRSASIPVSTPTTTTSYSSGSVGGYGYSGSTTSYGTKTEYIPFSVDRYEQDAGFFAPAKRNGLGILYRGLSRDVRREIGSNFGVEVLAVRKGSPAFNVSIVPGDIISEINGFKISDIGDVNTAINQSGSERNEISIIRKKDRLLIVATVPSGEW